MVAILTAVMLLPGILAVRIFYRAGQTNEVEPTVPSLGSTQGIALVGMFSVIVHFLYAFLLREGPGWLRATGVQLIDLPAPNPYDILRMREAGQATPDHVFALFFGLACLCLLAMAVGWVSGLLVVRGGDPAIFHGPLGGLLTTRRDDDGFVTAYVLSKLEKDGRAVGYQGTVASLLRDDDRFPAKVLLRQVSVFYLEFADDRPVRREMAETIDWIALSAADWHNIAFRVFKVVDDMQEQPASTGGPTAPLPRWLRVPVMFLAIASGARLLLGSRPNHGDQPFRQSPDRHP
ncbi:hypothetical protein NPJ82_12785 [Sphingomonas sp. NY01]|uniref:hypothetical protein n=1 Tax=Sphingomonas sp. NY01 TaxID=2968057 RepID=UPI00315D0CCE